MQRVAVYRWLEYAKLKIAFQGHSLSHLIILLLDTLYIKFLFTLKSNRMSPMHGLTVFNSITCLTRVRGKLLRREVYGLVISAT